MIRWVASPVIGNGQELVRGQESTTGPLRPTCSAYGDFLVVIDPSKGWAFGVLRNDDLSAAQADASLILLPTLPMTDLLTGAQATWLRGQLQSHGLPFAWVAAGDTVRSTIRTMIRWLEPTFETSWFVRVGSEDVLP